MGNNNRRALATSICQCSADALFGPGVNRYHRVIEYADGCIGQDTAGDRHSLVLASGKGHTVFADQSLVSFWQGGDKVVQLGIAACLNDCIGI